MVHSCPCAVYYAVIAGLGGEFQANSGCYSPIEVIAPEGTVVNAQPPAPVVNRIAVGHRVVNVILGALSQARPDHIPAAYYGVSYLYALQAAEGDQKGSVYLDSIVGGWGAEPSRDGASSFSCGLHNIASIPIEMIEDRHPITFTRYALRPDSGGAGKYRGGLGMIREWRLESDEGVFAANFDRFRHPPFGLDGGAPGAVGRLTLSRNGETQALGSKVGGVTLRRGDVITVETSGGGGFGAPSERDPAAVEADVETGYVTVASAVSDLRTKRLRTVVLLFELSTGRCPSGMLRQRQKFWISASVHEFGRTSHSVHAMMITSCCRGSGHIGPELPYAPYTS